MTRYQIKMLDADLTDLVHETSTQVTAMIVAASQGELRDMGVYRVVFDAVRDVLRAHVRGFHVCGCRRHCDEGAYPTPLRDPSRPPPDISAVNGRSPRIHRYVLSIDVPLKSFARALEIHILKAVAGAAPVKNWGGVLWPLIRDAVEPVLGKYVYASTTCNRGEYICEMGACTEYDPWQRVRPAADAGHPSGGSTEASR